MGSLLAGGVPGLVCPSAADLPAPVPDVRGRVGDKGGEHGGSSGPVIGSSILPRQSSANPRARRAAYSQPRASARGNAATKHRPVPSGTAFAGDKGRHIEVKRLLSDSGEDNIDVDSGTSQHADQGIDAEEIDSPADEVADPRLRDTEQLGRFRLGEAAILDELAYGDHESRTDPQVLGFILVEAQVPEYVSARWSNLRVLKTSRYCSRPSSWRLYKILYAYAGMRHNTLPLDLTLLADDVEESPRVGPLRRTLAPAATKPAKSGISVRSASEVPARPRRKSLRERPSSSTLIRPLRPGLTPVGTRRRIPKRYRMNDMNRAQNLYGPLGKHAEGVAVESRKIEPEFRRSIEHDEPR